GGLGRSEFGSPAARGGRGGGRVLQERTIGLAADDGAAQGLYPRGQYLVVDRLETPPIEMVIEADDADLRGIVSRVEHAEGGEDIARRDAEQATDQGIVLVVDFH